jgi:methyl-accepting chemotaxis protein
VVKNTGSVLEKFEAVEGGIITVSNQEERIRDAMEEQGAGSKQILEAICQLNEITRQVEDSSTEMLEGAKEVMSEGKSLEKATNHRRNGVKRGSAPP